MQQLQRALALIYPDQCILCETRVSERGGLCAACWRETPFIDGLVCETCGASLPGDADGEVYCDDCIVMPRPWEAGRAALAYRDAGRRIVLALKHADRLDIVPSCAGWMARAGAHVLVPGTVLVPVPAHWTRLLSRRYNQAAELSRALGRQTGLECLPSALVRSRRTQRQDGMTVEERFRNMEASIRPSPKVGDRLSGRDVCLVDDVMTSGATLAAATAAAHDAGAERVCILVLARVGKAP
ncbi:MAG: ComF family protein [Silicimonas sp.]|jgi:predicted amidophosphoribosyltransferase|nr:ComF family protein [Silicimonas sp.]